jgi:hypothetical protein
MNPWILAALCYLAACWLGSARLVNKYRCPQCDSDTAYARFAAAHSMRIRVALTASVIVLGPLLPFILAYCWFKLHQNRRAWRTFRRTHREKLFRFVHPVNMPVAAREHIEHLDPEFERLGFSAEGTYLLKPEPFAIHSKLLLSPEGESISDVSLLSETTAYSFTSVFEDGHVLETACTESVSPTDRINSSGRFSANLIDREPTHDSVAEVYQVHCEKVAELECRLGCCVLHFTSEQVKEVMTYANRVFGEVRFALGELDAPPEPAVCPNGSVPPVSV